MMLNIFGWRSAFKDGKQRELPIFIVVLALALLFGFLAIAYVQEIPVFEDEGQYIATAYGVSQYTEGAPRGVRIFHAGYVGALRAWLSLPFFEVFGVSRVALRMGPLLVFSISIVFFGLLLARTLGPLVAITSVALVALNPDVMLFSVVDSVPFVASFPVKISLCWLLLGWTGRPREYFAVSFLLLLGTFHRGDFVWVVLAFILSSLIFEDTVKRRILLACTALPSLLLALVMGLSIPSEQTFSLAKIHGENLKIFLRNIAWVFSGNGFHEGVLFPRSGVSSSLSGWILGGACVLGLLGWKWLNERERIVTKYLSVVVCVVFLAAFISVRADRPHNFLPVFPCFQVLGAIGIECGSRWLSEVLDNSKAAVRFTVGIVLLASVGNVASHIGVYRDLVRPVDGINFEFSKSLERLTEFRISNRRDHFLYLGWGAFDSVSGISTSWSNSYIENFEITSERIVRLLRRAQDSSARLLVVEPTYLVKHPRPGLSALDSWMSLKAVKMPDLKIVGPIFQIEKNGEIHYQVFDVVGRRVFD